MRSKLAAALTLGLTVCTIAPVAAQPPPPLPYGPVPPPRYEPVPPPPGPRYVWAPGHWNWDGVRYVWIPGRYIVRQPHYAHYAPGRWVWNGAAWVWRPAHWQ
jgi:WXXGXW repeat (2 copies)